MLFKDSSCVVNGFDQPLGKLRRQLKGGAVIVLEELAEKGFALPGMVGVGGIVIGDSVLHRIAKHLGSQRPIDLSFLGLRKAHRAKSQKKRFPAHKASNIKRKCSIFS